MLKIVGNDIDRDGQKVGWITGNDIIDASAHKIGWFQANDIFDRDGHKIGWVDGSYIHRSNSIMKISTQDNNQRVSGGGYSDICRAAIRLLIGD